MNKYISTRFTLLTGVGLFILSLASSSLAAEIDGETKLVDNCSHCHERNGASNDPNMPIIGGFSETYLIGSLRLYKYKERPCPEIEYINEEQGLGTTDMCKISKDLSEANIKYLAQYYAGKRFRRASQDFNSSLAKFGKLIHERDCEKCHSEGGSVASDDSGILAGQWTPYLKQQFFAFYAEKRKLDKKMEPKFNKLDKTEIEALLNFYASF